VCVCVALVFACGQHHFTFIEMSSSPWGRRCGAEACSPARIYRLPRIRGCGLRRAPPPWPRRGDPHRDKVQAGENRVSSPGHRLGAQPLPADTWKWGTIRCVFVHTPGRPIKQAQVCSGNNSPIKKTCHMWRVGYNCAEWYETHASQHMVIVLDMKRCNKRTGRVQSAMHQCIEYIPTQSDNCSKIFIKRKMYQL